MVDLVNIERDERRCRIGGADRHTTTRIHNGMLAVHRRGRRSVARVSAGPIAGPSATVVPATRVLDQVAGDRTPVSNLGCRDVGCSVREDTVIRHQVGVGSHLGERR